MQGRKKGLKSAICGGGGVKPLRSRSYGPENRFATVLQWGCAPLERLWETLKSGKSEKLKF